VLSRGECAALIGPNGAGKTTFLKTLLGEVDPLAGEVKLGASLRVGYFAQAHEKLRPDLTVLEEILASSPEMQPSEARNLLGRFLFSGDAVDKQVAILSGGERGRLALAKLALEGANLLLLDEPTTHLDIPSQEILQEAMSGFPETILLVSHDRYLIEALASQVWAISPEAREMAVYPGGYGEYAEARREQAESRKMSKQAQRRQRLVPARSRRRGAEIETVELRIAELEEELAAVGRLLELAGGDVERVRQLGSRYAQLETEVQKGLALWGRLQDEDESSVI